MTTVAPIFPYPPAWGLTDDRRPLADSSKFGSGVETVANRGVFQSDDQVQVSFFLSGREAYESARQFLEGNLIFQIEADPDAPTDNREWFVSGTIQFGFPGPHIYTLSFTAERANA